jgi:predicted nucleic acid-binding protein
LVKLVVDEPETASLHAYLNERAPQLTTSAIAVVEFMRAVRVAGLGAAGARRARQHLDEAGLVDIDRELLEAAISWTSARVRTIDAIHLASALRVGAQEIVVYDGRLAEAAAAAGLEVLSPGA